MKLKQFLDKINVNNVILIEVYQKSRFVSKCVDFGFHVNYFNELEKDLFSLRCPVGTLKFNINQDIEPTDISIFVNSITGETYELCFFTGNVIDCISVNKG